MLPDPHDRWVTELLGAPPPQENAVRCEPCVMQQDEHPPGCARPGFTFGPHKCCPYVPNLPNFVVGAALAHADRDEGELIRELLRAGSGVSPFGLFRTRSLEKLYDEVVEADLFGRTVNLVCPFFVRSSRGGCGIWRHRNATCATWYCKHDRGAVGMTFWRRLRDVLRAAEGIVADHCVLQLQLPIQAIEASCPPWGSDNRTSTLEDGAQRTKAWGPWKAREEQFYIACARVAGELPWAAIAEMGGVQLSLLVRLLREAHGWLAKRELPDRLELADFEKHKIDEATVRVCSYFQCDPLDLPTRLVTSLKRFNGRATTEVLAELAGEGIELGPDLLQQLVDFRVLVASGG